MDREPVNFSNQLRSQTHADKARRKYTEAANAIRKQDGEVDVPELAEKLQIKEESAWLYLLQNPKVRAAVKPSGWDEKARERAAMKEREVERRREITYRRDANQKSDE